MSSLCNWIILISSLIQSWIFQFHCCIMWFELVVMSLSVEQNTCDGKIMMLLNSELVYLPVYIIHVHFRSQSIRTTADWSHYLCSTDNTTLEKYFTTISILFLAECPTILINIGICSVVGFSIRMHGCWSLLLVTRSWPVQNFVVPFTVQTPSI